MEINSNDKQTTNLYPSTKQGKIGKAFLVYIVVLAGIAGLVMYLSATSTNSQTNPMTDGTSAPIESINSGTNNTSVNSDTSQPVATGSGDSSNSTSQSTYKDGTYSAEGSYMSPAGPEKIGVSLTLKKDTVVAATVTNEAQDGQSSRYQNRFISGFKQYVIGQNISNIHLDVVSGSSLTPRGFNQAVANIEAQAKA